MLQNNPMNLYMTVPQLRTLMQSGSMATGHGIMELTFIHAVTGIMAGPVILIQEVIGNTPIAVTGGTEATGNNNYV
jgi:hypothetical protein